MKEGWKIELLKDACTIHDNLRKPINRKERAKRIEGKEESELIPYYGATGQVGYIDEFLTDGEYVLIGEDAAPFLDYSKDVAYLISGKAWVNNHAHILRSKYDNRFLLHYLNSFNFHGWVSGTTRLKLTQGKMKEIPVPVPPLPEQPVADGLEREIEGALDRVKGLRMGVLRRAFKGELLTEEELKLIPNESE